MTRVMEIPMTDYYKLRVWKEYFFKYTESSHNQDYQVDRDEQLDLKAKQVQQVYDNYKDMYLKAKRLLEEL